MEACGILLDVSSRMSASRVEHLIGAAYACEKIFPTVLVVPRETVDRRRVDIALDRAVSRYGIRFPGVIFLDGDEGERVVKLARRAECVIASSQRLRRQLQQAGIPFLTPKEGIHHLEGSPLGRSPAIFGL